GLNIIAAILRAHGRRVVGEASLRCHDRIQGQLRDALNVAGKLSGVSLAGAFETVKQACRYDERAANHHGWQGRKLPLLLELLHALLETSLEFIRPQASLAGVDPGVRTSGELLNFELFRPMVPVV